MEVEAERNVDIVSRLICYGVNTAGGIKVEELPGNFGHPWAAQNWGQP
jgi:hypothetical protein